MVAVSSPVKTFVGDLKRLYYKQKDDIDQSIKPHPLWEAISSYSFSKLPSPMGKVAPIPNQTKLLPPHGQAAIKFPISCIQKLVKWPQVIQQSS